MTYLFTFIFPLIVTVYFIATKNKDALPNALLPKKTNVFSTHEDVISKNCHSQNDRNPSILTLQYEPPGLQLLTNENTSCRRSAMNVQSSENWTLPAVLVPECLETTPCLFHSRHPGFQKNAPQFLVFHPSHPDCLERKEKIVFIYIYKKVFFSHTGPGFFGWDFLFRFGITKEQQVLDLGPCQLYCPTFKQLQMSPPRYSQYHEGINGFATKSVFHKQGSQLFKPKTGHLHSSP